MALFLHDSAMAMDREQANEDAHKAFLKLEFFSEGRGMNLMPGLIEIMEKMNQSSRGQRFLKNLFSNRWGLNWVESQPVGLMDVSYKAHHVGVLSCVACHSGRAAGIFIPGLGNKNIDVLQIGEDAHIIENLYKTFNFKANKDEDYKIISENALALARLLSDRNLGNLKEGLVPVSFVRTWFFRQANQEWPADMPKGQVKVPSLWGYGEKRKVGQFSDGFGNGQLPGWAIAVELTAGQTVSAVRNYLPKVYEAEDVFSNFLPVKYPFAIDDEKARLGKAVFTKTCAGCHGTYEIDNFGLAIYERPRWIPWEFVRTDEDRLLANTPAFYELVANNPLSDIIQTTSLGQGYFAPRLVGIWSRFPYLHNGSVPSIAALLMDPSQRPIVFSLLDAGERSRFDEASLGLTTPAPGSQAETAMLRAAHSERSLYDTREKGLSSQGHPFGVDLSSEEKTQLIEYLKTL